MNSPETGKQEMFLLEENSGSTHIFEAVQQEMVSPSNQVSSLC
jgi:hypothetical protein